MNYKDLEIWKLSKEIVIEVHKMSLNLPKLKLMKKLAKLEDHQSQQNQTL